MFLAANLVSQELDTSIDICNEDEILDGTSSVDIDLCVNESNAYQILVLLQAPHKDLNTYNHKKSFKTNTERK